MRSTPSAERRALLGLLLAGALPAQAQHARPGDWLNEAMPGLMAALKVPGAQVVLLQGGAPAWSACWGRTEQDGPPVRPDTVFESASMSKPVFAYLVLQQVQAGRLRLDQPVVELLPEAFAPPQPWQRLITARMLLAHTSGLPNWRPEAGPSENEGPLRLQFQPGQRFDYSGEGYFYLQRVMEQLTGLPLERLAQQQLFEPLGMADSGFVLTPALRRQRARGHAEDGSPLPPSEYRHANAAYTLFTTASDYARFIAVLMQGLQRGDPGLREMLSHQVAAPGREPIRRPGGASGQSVFWGLGWGIDTSAQGDIAYHTGTNSSGFRNYCQFSPSRGSGLVLMTNSLAGNRLRAPVVAAIGDV